MPISKAGNRTDIKGFTLIELAVVTLLIALFAGLTIPLLFGGGQRDLRSTGRRISGMTRWCYNEAALSGREHQLVFDLERQVFFVRRLRPTANSSSSPDRAKNGRRPARFNSKDVAVTGRGRFSSQTVAIRILPVGWLEETVVHLESDDGEQLTLRLMSLSGTSETYDGYREF
ncbi:MAG: prepilin-type N-terminal cleavage/methylation domain-containing protein [Syntrophotaleaceae bacterium]